MLAALAWKELDAYWPLDLRETPGAFTQWRIRLLAAQPAVCLRVLSRSEVRAAAVEPLPLPDGCGYADGVAVSAGGLEGAPVMRCAAAAAFAAWERHTLQPAAERHLGARVTAIRNFGTLSCRDIAGRPGRRSQHATANAVDVSAFALSDGRTVTLVRDWSDTGPAGRFLHEIRDGACGLFAGVLSPDWNAAHRDHVHFDMGSADVCR